MEMSSIQARRVAHWDALAGPGSRIHLPAWAIAGLAALAAIAIQSLWIPVDADVSWLITVSERVIAGDRLYVDIFEVNPPASVWLYVPLVWAATLAGIRPEALVVLGFAAAGVASTLASARLAARLGRATSPAMLTAALAFVTLLLPMALFAQREHAAMLLALPTLAALALVAQRKPHGHRLLVASGIAAGLLIVIKPYFLPAVLVPAAWAIWTRRSLVPFLPAIAAAAAVIGAYGAAILLFARPYLEWIPVLARTYGPMHDQLWKVLIGPALYPALAIALGALARPRRIGPLACAWGLGAAGFLLAAYLQAKNYPNHWLPQAGLAIAAAAAVAASAGVLPKRRVAVMAALAAIAFFQMYQWAIRPDAAVEAAIRADAPPSPTIIALSPQLTTGHPVTRNVGGRWVGSRAALFTASGAVAAGLGDDLLRGAYREDIDSFRREVENNRPDVVLVSVPTKRWLMKEPAVAGAMAAYAPVSRAGETEVWVRRRPR